MRTRLIFLVALISTMAWYKYAETSSTFVATSNEQSLSKERDDSTTEAALAEGSAEPITPAPASVAEVIQNQSPLIGLAPSREDYRAAVTENTHTTPTALLQFTGDLYKKEQTALQSSGNAKAFFAELEACATASEQLKQVQAICWLSARRVRDTYPELASDFAHLKAQLDPQVLRLTEMFER